VTFALLNTANLTSITGQAAAWLTNHVLKTMTILPDIAADSQMIKESAQLYAVKLQINNHN
jgi:hypothetical protein